MIIKKVEVEIIPDSNGNNTVQVIVNRKYVGSAPLGISKSKYEVISFPENVLTVVNYTINKGLNGLKFNDFKDLEEIEKILFNYDNSENLEKIGGNTVIALESALLKAASNNNVWKLLDSNADEMPIPIGCCIGGGKHAVDSCDFQEFLVIPHGENFNDNLLVNKKIYSQIKNNLGTIKKSFTGGWATKLDNLSILDFLKKISEEILENFNIHVGLGIDVAGSHLFNGGDYFYRKGKLTRENQIRYVNELINRYSLEYVEDPLNEDDIEGFGKIKGDLICGDDLICSDVKRLEKHIGKVNCVCIKPTQIGSLLKIKELIDFSKSNRVETVISHRSGETNDTLIADLAVGWKIPYIKTGISINENIKKIRRLQEIEKNIK